MSSSLLSSSLIGCRGPQLLLLLAVAMVHTCLLPTVAAVCPASCQGLHCQYGRAYDNNGCPLCDCFLPCENVTCPVGQRCEVVRAPICAGISCPTYLGRCAATPAPCPTVNCTGVYCRYGYVSDDNGCRTCRCRDLCARHTCPPGQVCKVTSVDCEPGDNCRDSPMSYCAPSNTSSYSSSTTTTTAVATSTSTTTLTASTTRKPVNTGNRKKANSRRFATTTTRKPTTTRNMRKTTSSTVSSTTSRRSTTSTTRKPTTTRNMRKTTSSTVSSTTSRRPTTSTTRKPTTTRNTRKTTSSTVSSTTPSTTTTTTTMTSPTVLPTSASTTTRRTTTTPPLQTSTSRTKSTAKCPVLSCHNLVCQYGREIDSQGCPTCRCIQEICQYIRCAPGYVCKVTPVYCEPGQICRDAREPRCTLSATSSGSSSTATTTTVPTITSTTTLKTSTTRKPSTTRKQATSSTVTTSTSRTTPTATCPVVNCHELVCQYGQVIDSRGCPTCRCVQPCQTMRCPSGQTCKISEDDETPYCHADNQLLEGIIRIDAKYSIIVTMTKFKQEMKRQIGSYLKVSSKHVVVTKVCRVTTNREERHQCRKL